MTVRTPPSWLQNGSHPAENDRLTTQALWATTGIINSASLLVHQNTPAGLSVVVDSGWAAIVGTTQVNMGTYVTYNDASVVLSLNTADPTNPRIDLICATVNDAYYTGALNNVVLQVVAGTPAGSPVAPTLPANSISLATVAVGAGATTITNANITDLRTRAELTETIISATATATNTLVLDGIAGQTGKALRVNDSTGTQKFAVSVDGTLTFQDGSTQITAGVYDPSFTINTQSGTTYTLVAGDAQKLVTLSNASAITLTVASNATQALPVGTQVTISQFGVGQVTVVGASSPNPVTINGTPGLKLRTQWSSATLIQTSTDNWLIVGDLSA